MTRASSRYDPRKRAFWRTVHLWLGLTIGLLWAVSGLTGALLVFHRELDRIGGSALTAGPMLPPERLLGAAAAVSGRPILRLTRVSADPRLVEARFADGSGRTQALELDAATGRLVGRRERDPATPFTGSAWRWIYLVHMSLMAGPTGRTVIGASGLVLLLSVGAGLGLAWPKRRQWRAAFAWRKWRALPQRLWGWHRAIGLVAAVPAGAMALTGSYMTFEGRLAPLLAAHTSFQPLAALGHAMTGSSTQAANRVAVAAGTAYALARTRFPEGEFMNLELPAEHPGYYSIRFTLPQEWRRWSGRAMVQVDAHTSTIIGVYDPRRVAIVNRVDDDAYPFHIGEMGGLGGRALVALLGLALPVFYVTGVWLWWRRRKPTAKVKRTPAPWREGVAVPALDAGLAGSRRTP